LNEQIFANDNNENDNIKTNNISYKKYYKYFFLITNIQTAIQSLQI